MQKNPNWKPVTESTSAAPTDPRAQPINFELTPEERNIAVMARIEIIAMKKADFTPGVVVKHVSESDLTESERRAFGIIGGDA